MDINGTKMAAATGIGVVGSYIASLFGGWSADLEALILFMAVDFVTGLIVAGVFKKSGKSESGALQSKAGWIGLCKKVGTFLLVLVAHQLDKAVGLNFVRTATIIGFIVNELISIVENAGLMGLPVPTALAKAIEVLKTKAEKENK